MKGSIVLRIMFVMVTFLIYSGTGICSKIASMYPFMSAKYLFYFGCVIFLLALYAVLWQKVLSYMTLSKAYLFKSVTIVFALTYSHFLFSEVITMYNIVGTFMIINGILILSNKSN